ncbi:hypothetical protein G4D82_02475 [Flavobacterium sp. CYK-4]|uniref:hypothetical protein n=1 Tax=Flavobacterium lotistagni TaxID=2709660 RepID=UPI001408AD67|nr:hypothetical protein [Flavobacterium lotistagni]NHM06074.1 hypothetical protein [Flavobacterium lotistagni]
MKKLFFTLIASFLFGLVANAQNGSYTKSAMTVAVAAAKGTYTKGMSYQEWLKNQIGTTVPAKEEEKFLSDIFNYLSTGANSETVLKTYDGKSMINLALLSSKGGLKALQGATLNNQNRFCWMCLIKLVVDLICEIVPCGGPVIQDMP